MGAPRRITIRMPEETVRAVDEAAARQGCSRSEVIRETLEWHLRLRTLPIEEPTPEEPRLPPAEPSMLAASSRPSTRSGVT